MGEGAELSTPAGQRPIAGWLAGVDNAGSTTDFILCGLRESWQQVEVSLLRRFVLQV